MSDRFHDNAPEIVRAVVVDPDIDVHVRGGGDNPPPRRYEESRLEEAVGLAMALDLEIAGTMSVRVRKLNPATLFGEGKVLEIKAL